MRLLLTSLLMAATLALTQCMSYDFARRTAQQGNLLPQTKIERLRIGMNKDDVAILMGTSLLSPSFNNDRWDYAYTWRRGNNASEAHHIALYFKNNTLVKIENSP